jgi:hypothetical protein
VARRATAIAGRLGKTTFFTALTGARTPGARVKGSVTRHAQIQTQQLSGNGLGCGSGSGGPAPTPDCGRHAFNGTVEMRWATPAEWPGEPPVPLVPVPLLEGPHVGNLGIAGMYKDCPGGQADQLIPTERTKRTVSKTDYPQDSGCTSPTDNSE